MAEQATQLVEHNDLSDVVKVMHCRAEELEIPDKVDLIVSEWMGTLLLVCNILHAKVMSVIYTVDPHLWRYTRQFYYIAEFQYLDDWIIKAAG